MNSLVANVNEPMNKPKNITEYYAIMNPNNAPYANNAPYKCDPTLSRGRLIEEKEMPMRSPFQRDRDRVIHSGAFRRLKHKTQVFVAHKGSDHYRTRLTHSLEVAQIARSIASIFGTDENLTETIALAHDLGHTPFGHEGEHMLNHLMRDHGGFNHNAQTIRIVRKLEKRYARFDGLNLSWETIEGLLKHNGPIKIKGKKAPRYQASDIPKEFTQAAKDYNIPLEKYPTAEAQIASIADDIAYNAHDLDDGLRAGLFEIIDIADLPLIGKILAQTIKKWPHLENERLIHEMIRKLISEMITDVIARGGDNIKKNNVKNADDIRNAHSKIIEFSPQMNEYIRVIAGFLQRRMYYHPHVKDKMTVAKRVIRELFYAYQENPENMPVQDNAPQTQEHPNKNNTTPRMIADKIAAMTDSSACREYERLFDLKPIFR